ncbi:carbonic anhydrase-related protein 10-like isoform X2 [Parasteatoda tepidariorum]|uniref:carbonic anhydrase-related protein 10-like isoform X2 n=1 Tax=Parasteatoda tepidariorum TaxID=114398 RepID=UPI0039BD2A3F
MTKITLINFFLFLFAHTIGVYSSWEEWWTYDGISGPDYWGLLNPDWKLCTRGRRQSPVNIEPSVLLYDAAMGKVDVDEEKVNGTLKNTGHSVRFRLDPDSPSVMVNGGPLSYKYRVHEILLHYGRTDDKGSEHTISGHAFPAELQILGYNNQLYDNMSEAIPKTQGVVGLAVMMQLANISSPDVRLLTSNLEKILHKGESQNITHISVRGLLPDTSQFMTYEGSITMPGCHETVTWIILNKPVYITKAEIFLMRKLMQGDKANPKTILANNYRPPQPLYNRSVRTNVFNHDIGDNKCFNSRKLFYRGREPDRSVDSSSSKIFEVKNHWLRSVDGKIVSFSQANMAENMEYEPYETEEP